MGQFRWEHLLGFFPKAFLPLRGHVFLRRVSVSFFLTLKSFPLFWDRSVGLTWIFHFVWCVSIYKPCFSHLLCFTLSLFPWKKSRKRLWKVCSHFEVASIPVLPFPRICLPQLLTLRFLFPFHLCSQRISKNLYFVIPNVNFAPCFLFLVYLTSSFSVTVLLPCAVWRDRFRSEAELSFLFSFSPLGIGPPQVIQAHVPENNVTYPNVF